MMSRKIPLSRTALSAALTALILAGLSVTTSAQAAQILKLKDGRTSIVNDSLVAPTSDITMGRYKAPQSRSSLTARSGKSVSRVLMQLRDSGAIDSETYKESLKIYKDALRTQRKLKGTRRTELTAVINTLKRLAASNMLTSSRVKPLFLTLQRNREWWSTGALLSYGQRVTFSGSQLIFQYYPGQGIQLQMLANFGKLNNYWNEKKKSSAKRLADELIPLAANRGNGIAWEYYFSFGTGSPPWISALSQGTAIQSLARVGDLTGEASYIEAAKQGVGAFSTNAPVGVRTDSGTGTRYLMYSFDRKLNILNGFIQSLVGLHDYATIAQDSEAMKLFEAADAQAQADTKAFDTGAWSLYHQSKESDLGYHKLLRDFLKNLCKRTSTDTYCRTEDNFTGYLSQKPVVKLLTKKAKRGKKGVISLQLSKISRVGITVKKGSKTVFTTSAQLSYGKRTFSWIVPKKRGSYSVTLTATDLAGNGGSGSGSITVR